MRIVSIMVLLLIMPLYSYGDEKIVFATDWKAQAEHGGFYQALATGLYKKHGLDVAIRMGGPGIDNQQLMAAGAVDFAIGGRPKAEIPDAQHAGEERELPQPVDHT